MVFALAFAKRLRQALEDAGVAPTASALREGFNSRFTGVPISWQTAQNWLHGKYAPRQDKMRVLAYWLHVDWTLLMLGESRLSIAAEVPAVNYGQEVSLADQQMWQNYLHLSDENKMLVRNMVQALVAGEN